MEKIKEEEAQEDANDFHYGIINAFEAYTRTKHAQDRIYKEEIEILHGLIEERVADGLMYLYIEGDLCPRVRRTLRQVGYKVFSPEEPIDTQNKEDSYCTKIVWFHEGLYPPETGKR